MQTIFIIKKIKEIMQEYKEKIKKELPKIYSQELINNLFKHPYTKIDFIVDDLQVTRQTASRYLDQLVELGLLHFQKIGKENFYINIRLFEFLNEATQLYKLND